MAKYDIQKGIHAIKDRNIWKQVGGVALGSLVGGLGSVVMHRIMPDAIGRSGKYAAGTCVSAGITIGCFALNFPNAGIGAATITANQALNTAVMLITDKTVTELINT